LTNSKKTFKITATKSDVAPSEFFPWLSKKDALEFDSKHSLYSWEHDNIRNFICVEKNTVKKDKSKTRVKN